MNKMPIKKILTIILLK